MLATSTLAASLLSPSGSAIAASSSSSASQTHPHPRGYCLLMAASRGSHVGGARDLLAAAAAKPRLSSSSSSSVKTAAAAAASGAAMPRASATAVSPSASSQGATSRGERPFLSLNSSVSDCHWLYFVAPELVALAVTGENCMCESIVLSIFVEAFVAVMWSSRGREAGVDFAF